VITTQPTQPTPQPTQPTPIKPIKPQPIKPQPENPQIIIPSKPEKPSFTYKDVQHLVDEIHQKQKKKYRNQYHKMSQKNHMIH
jgi:DNA polymerase IIIc chi subunit